MGSEWCLSASDCLPAGECSLSCCSHHMVHQSSELKQRRAGKRRAMMGSWHLQDWACLLNAGLLIQLLQKKKKKISHEFSNHHWSISACIMQYICICLFVFTIQENLFFRWVMLWHHSTLVLFTKLPCSYTVIKRKHISRKPLTKPNNSDVQLFEVESLPSTDVVFHGIMGLVPMTWSSGVHSSLGGIHCIHSAKIVKRTLYVHAIDVCIIFRHYSVAHRNDSCFSRWSYAVPPQARNKMLTPLVSPCSIVHLLREPFAANVLIYSTEWAGNKALTLKAAGQLTAPFPRCFKLRIIM